MHTNLTITKEGDTHINEFSKISRSFHTVTGVWILPTTIREFIELFFKKKKEKKKQKIHFIFKSRSVEKKERKKLP